MDNPLADPGRFTLAEARTRLVPGKYIATDVTVTLHLHIAPHKLREGETAPETPDQDCGLEASLPSEAETPEGYFPELFATFRKSIIGSERKTISLQDVMRLFHIDPMAQIWECGHEFESFGTSD